MKATGVFIATPVAQTMIAIISLIYFLTGSRWKKQKVL